MKLEFPKVLCLDMDVYNEFLQMNISKSFTLAPIFCTEDELYDKLISANDEESFLEVLKIISNYKDLSDKFIDAVLFKTMMTHRDTPFANVAIKIISKTNRAIELLSQYDYMIDEYTIETVVSLIDNIPLRLVIDVIHKIPKEYISKLDLEDVNQYSRIIHHSIRATQAIFKLLLTDPKYDYISKDIKKRFITDLPYRPTTLKYMNDHISKIKELGLDIATERRLFM